MKNRLYRLFLPILLISSPLVFAIPPYLGVAAEENLSFDNPSCLHVARTVLEEEGFQNVVQYKQSPTLFAAYQNHNPYHYKALVKCLPESGTIIVVVVANVAIDARKKASSLLQKTSSLLQKSQQSSDIKHVQIIKHALTEVEDSVTVPTKEPLEEEEVKNDKKISKASQYTTFNLGKCLNRAEISLRESGFYKDFDFDDDSIYATNDRDYKGFIRCVNSESLISFQVKGGNSRVRDQLLNQLQKNF